MFFCAILTRICSSFRAHLIPDLYIYLCSEVRLSHIPPVYARLCWSYARTALLLGCDRTRVNTDFFCVLALW